MVLLRQSPMTSFRKRLHATLLFFPYILYIFHSFYTRMKKKQEIFLVRAFPLRPFLLFMPRVTGSRGLIFIAGISSADFLHALILRCSVYYSRCVLILQYFSRIRDSIRLYFFPRRTYDPIVVFQAKQRRGRNVTRLSFVTGPDDHSLLVRAFLSISTVCLTGGKHVVFRAFNVDIVVGKSSDF